MRTLCPVSLRQIKIMVVKLQELLFVAYLREDEDSVSCIFELPQHLGHQLQLAP